VVRRPDVVVVQERDERRAGLPDPAVARARDARLADWRTMRSGVVGGGVQRVGRRRARAVVDHDDLDRDVALAEAHASARAAAASGPSSG
jgi:hypothetical protein